MEPEARPGTPPTPAEPSAVPAQPSAAAEPSAAAAPSEASAPAESSVAAAAAAPASVVVVEGEQSDAEVEASAKPVRLGKREGRSPRDMVMSLLILLIPIALLLTFYRVVLSGDAPVTVDASVTIREAQAAGLFPVAVPAGLSDDWHTTSATFRRAPEGATLRLGYVAPDDDAALVVESNVPGDQLLPTELGKEAKPRGTFRDGEVAWRSYLSRPNEIALVLTDQTRTIIVLGNTDEKNLQTLAAVLS